MNLRRLQNLGGFKGSLDEFKVLVQKEFDNVYKHFSVPTTTDGGGTTTIITQPIDPALSANWNAAYAHSLITSGNPHRVALNEIFDPYSSKTFNMNYPLYFQFSGMTGFNQGSLSSYLYNDDPVGGWLFGAANGGVWRSLAGESGAGSVLGGLWAGAITRHTSGNVSYAFGVHAETWQESVGHVKIMAAFAAAPYTADGTIDDVAAFYVAPWLAWGTGTATNAYGLFIPEYSINGLDSTNLYGIYLAPVTGGSSKNYAIYSAGGKSFHKGTLYLGVDRDTPQRLLCIEHTTDGQATNAASFYNIVHHVITADESSPSFTPGEVFEVGTEDNFNRHMYSRVAGIYVYPWIGGSGTLGYLWGIQVDCSAWNNPGGTVDHILHYTARWTPGVAVTVGEMVGFEAQGLHPEAGGTIGTSIGMRLQDISGNNAYGIYISGISGLTNEYAIYVADGKCYFYESVQIGSWLQVGAHAGINTGISPYYWLYTIAIFDSPSGGNTLAGHRTSLQRHSATIGQQENNYTIGNWVDLSLVTSGSYGFGYANFAFYCDVAGLGDGSIGTLVGYRAGAVTYNTVAVSNYYAFVADGWNQGGSGTISNIYLFYGAAIGSGLSNAYGIYLNAVSGASGNNAAIYAAGGQSYFRDSLCINHTLGAAYDYAMINIAIDSTRNRGIYISKGTNDQGILIGVPDAGSTPFARGGEIDFVTSDIADNVYATIQSFNRSSEVVAGIDWITVSHANKRGAIRFDTRNDTDFGERVRIDEDGKVRFVTSTGYGFIAPRQGMSGSGAKLGINITSAQMGTDALDWTGIDLIGHFRVRNTSNGIGVSANANVDTPNQWMVGWGFNLHATADGSGNYQIPSDGANIARGGGIFYHCYQSTATLRGTIRFFQVPNSGSTTRNVTYANLQQYETMRIYEGGTVFINPYVADTPVVSSAQLHVYYSGGAYIIARNASNDIEMCVGADSAAALAGAMTSHAFQLRTNNTTRMTISSGGYTRIGDSGAPGGTYILEVAGDTIISKTGTTTVRIGSVSSTGLGQIELAGNDTSLGYANVLKPAASITALRTWTLPNATGTLITTGNLSSIVETGLIATYNGITTEGLGLSAVVDSVHLTNQNSSVGTTNLTNTATAGRYRVSVYLHHSSSDIDEGTVYCTIAWREPDESSSYVSRSETTDTVNFALGPQYTHKTFFINNQGSAAMTYATTAAGFTGDDKYRLAIIVERLA